MSGSTLRLVGNYVEIVDEVLTLALCEQEFEQGFLLYVMRPIPGRYEYFDCDDESYELGGRDQIVAIDGADSWSLEGGRLKILLKEEASRALGFPSQLDLRVDRANPSIPLFLRALRVALSPPGFLGVDEDLEIILEEIEQRYGE